MIKLRIIAQAAFADKQTFNLKGENVLAVFPVGTNIWIVYDVSGGDPYP